MTEKIHHATLKKLKAIGVKITKNEDDKDVFTHKKTGFATRIPELYEEWFDKQGA